MAKIGYFVPITKTLNEFKEGPNLITNEDKALNAVMFDRNRLAKLSDKKRLMIETINKPLTPSEAFLSIDSNEFPSFFIKEQLANIASNPDKYILPNYIGEIKFKEDGEIYWEENQDLKPLTTFPITDTDDKTGAIVLFHKPDFDQYFNSYTYIIGCDTLDKAKSTTDSLFSCFVMNRFTRQIVAEFTGRREDPNDHYEIVRRLALYYKATIMYEQNLPGLYTYFSNCRSLYLLADTPSHLRNKDTYLENSNTSKGINATTVVNKEGRRFTYSWLIEKLSEKNPDYRVVHTIRSVPLLKELLNWNIDGNFDRVSALGMLMWYDVTLYRDRENKDQSDKQVKSFIDHDYFKKFKTKKISINELQIRSVSQTKTFRQ